MPFLLEQGTGIEQLLIYDLPNVFYNIVRIYVQNSSWNIDETKEENAPASEKSNDCVVFLPNINATIASIGAYL